MRPVTREVRRRPRARILLGAGLLLSMASFAVTVRAEEITAAEREQAVRSLRDYQSVFMDRRIELEARVRKDFRPAESSGPVWYDLELVAADGWMYIEEDTGPLMSIGIGASGGNQETRDDANIIQKSVYKLGARHGLSVDARSDGRISQANRTCGGIGIFRLSGLRLAQAMGWTGFWPTQSIYKDLALDAAEALELSPAVRRVDVSDKQTRLVANLTFSEFRNDDRQLEMWYSDLPDVRLTAVRKTSDRYVTTGEIRYRSDQDGFHQPYAFREIRRRTETPPRIELVEVLTITRFSMRETSEPQPMPVIEVPEGVRYVEDPCPDVDPDEDNESRWRRGVPLRKPVPDPRQ